MGLDVADFQRIEAHALGMVFGRKRPGSGPLMIGSIKPNIGHLEGAAGIAGLIKAVLMVERGSLLPSGGFTEPNPAIPFTELGLRVVDELQEWPVVAGRPRRAGVSSFGFGGTNAHVIVEEAGSVGADTVSGRADVGGSGGGVVAWVISGKTASALAAQAGRLGRYVRARPALDVVDVGYSLVSTRSVFDHRAVVVGQTRDELLAGLAGVVAGRPEAGVVCGVGKPAGKTAFVFAGQGSQWLGMGSELYAAYPVFAEALDAVVDELDRHLRYPLRDVIWGHDQDLLNTTEFAQPALFAVEVALYRLLMSWGVRPGLVLGHSVGELAAAHVAGALCLPDAAMLVAARGRLMQALPAGGAMFAVQAREDEVAPMLGHDVSIAAVNGPASVVISGAHDAVSAIADRLRGHYEGVLHGVPIGVKDLCYTVDAPTAAGTTIFRDFRPAYDATVVARLRAAGAVIIGKLAMTEGAYLGYHPSLPTPVNPWDPTAWAGVSSSGCGVATAAGLCFGSIGSDTGGSIRFPTSMCGVTGIKPTWS